VVPNVAGLYLRVKPVISDVTCLVLWISSWLMNVDRRQQSIPVTACVPTIRMRALSYDGHPIVVNHWHLSAIC
jgi:hypothetical protein